MNIQLHASSKHTVFLNIGEMIMKTSLIVHEHENWNSTVHETQDLFAIFINLEIAKLFMNDISLKYC